MSMRLAWVMRVCCQVLRVILQAGLVVWAAMAPLVWILRDGLGPDMVESGWARSVFKFLVGWCVPATVLAVPLIGLSRVDRWLARSAAPGSRRAGET